jgi:hypothetical protein
MPRSPATTGVCVVRVTHEPAGLVVHLTSRLDVEDASGESRATVGSIDQGVALVRRFLEEYRRTTKPAGGTRGGTGGRRSTGPVTPR